MQWIKRTGIRVAGFVFTASIGGGILLWLGSKGIYPEQWSARAFGLAEKAVMSNLAGFWILVGAAGLVGLWLGPRVYRRGIVSSESTNIAHTPPVSTPPEPSEFADSEVAVRWTKKYGTDYTVGMVRRIWSDNGVKAREQLHLKNPFDIKKASDLFSYTSTHFISRSELQRIESGEIHSLNEGQPGRGRIALAEAMRRSHEVAKGKSIGTVAERNGNIEYVYANSLLRFSGIRIPVYGRSPNSEINVEIRREHLSDFRLSDDCQELREDGPNGSVYVDLKVNESDLPVLFNYFEGK